MAQEMISRVWQLAGLIGSVTPGILSYSEGKVAYVTNEGTRFQVPLSELKEVKWPFLRMGLGFDAVINGEKYKFSFMKPNASAPDLDDSTAEQYLKALHVGRFWDSIGTLRNVKADKATTKAWKELLKNN